MSRKEGSVVEGQVKSYLLKQGLRWLASNYYCRCGELDLIMRDGNYLVFIEVRSRSAATYGGALASVSLAKQRKIIKAALYYLTMNNLHDKYPVRFDVVSVQGMPATIEWVKNAFTADSF